MVYVDALCYCCCAMRAVVCLSLLCGGVLLMLSALVCCFGWGVLFCSEL